jgi:hypothetical protein
MRKHGTTPSGSPPEGFLFGEPRLPRPRRRLGFRRTVRVLVRLARARRWLRHVPTLGQIRTMAWLDGHDPCSYLLDRGHNFVPEPLEFGYERELGRHALSFSCRSEWGRLMEMVVMSDGGGFDLIGC